MPLLSLHTLSPWMHAALALARIHQSEHAAQTPHDKARIPLPEGKGLHWKTCAAPDESKCCQLSGSAQPPGYYLQTLLISINLLRTSLNPTLQEPLKGVIYTSLDWEAQGGHKPSPNGIWYICSNTCTILSSQTCFIFFPAHYMSTLCHSSTVILS